MRHAAAGLAILGGLAAAASAQPGPGLRVRGRRLETTRRLQYTVSVPAGYRLAGPESRRAEFHGHPFDVSLAAFLAEDAFVMIHSERVADKSGASNYEDLPADRLDGFPTRSRSMCAELSARDVSGEHDLKFLADHGFAPEPAILLKQHFLTTSDHNEEVVVSLGRRAGGCGEQALPGSLRKTLLRELEGQVHLGPVPRPVQR
jgi:hypothetical protein